MSLLFPQERKPFDVADQIEWPRLADALNKRWVLSNGRELSPECMAYLGNKLFPGKVYPISSHPF